MGKLSDRLHEIQGLRIERSIVAELFQAGDDEIRRLELKVDAAEMKAAKFQEDWVGAKYEFGTQMAAMRDRVDEAEGGSRVLSEACFAMQQDRDRARAQANELRKSLREVLEAVHSAGPLVWSNGKMQALQRAEDLLAFSSPYGTVPDSAVAPAVEASTAEAPTTDAAPACTWMTHDDP